MSNSEILTHRFINKFDYVNGVLHHKNGEVADTWDKKIGYYRVWDGEKAHLSHRVVYEMFNGAFEGNIDHKDRDPKNNDISNLRVCCQSENTMNSTIRKDNTSGYKGVTWHKQAGKWAAQTMLKGKRVHIGLFTYPREAGLAYNHKVEELFGEFCVFNLVFE